MPDSNSTYFDQFNQSMVLTADNILDPAALEAYGIPYFT